MRNKNSILFVRKRKDEKTQTYTFDYDYFPILESPLYRATSQRGKQRHCLFVAVNDQWAILNDELQK